jgi:hypothetical protein
MKKISSEDQQFIVKHKTALFSGSDILMQIATGELQHPKFQSDSEISQEVINPFDDVLTFGQLISWQANSLNLTLKELSLASSIPMVEIVQIYDDLLIPWDLPVPMMLQLAKALKIPDDVLLSILENHYVEPGILNKQINTTDSYLQASQFENTDEKLRLIEDSEQQNKRKYIVQLSNAMKNPE